MIDLFMPPEIEERYRREKAEERAHLRDLWPARSKNDTRWVGRAAEHLLDAELGRQGIPHAWNGGVDHRPDFEIAGLGVALKCNVGKYRPDFGFTIPQPLLERLPAMTAFCIYEQHRRTLVLVGVASKNTLRRKTEFRPTGSPGFRGPTPYSCYVIAADQLSPWEEFVAWAQGLAQEVTS